MIPLWYLDPRPKTPEDYRRIATRHAIVAARLVTVHPEMAQQYLAIASDNSTKATELERAA